MTFRFYADAALSQSAEYTDFTEPASQYWEASHAYALADWVYGDDRWYECTVAGTSGASEPTWPTGGGTVVDGGATWTDQGEANDATTGKRPADVRRYFGSSDAADVGWKAQANSDPGVDQLTISVVDSAVGSGHEATEVYLSLTEAGLDTAVAGADLDIGLQVLAGVGGAVEFWVRAYDATETAGTSTELSFQTNEYARIEQ